MLSLQAETKEPMTVDHTGAPSKRLGARPFKVQTVCSRKPIYARTEQKVSAQTREEERPDRCRWL